MTRPTQMCLECGRTLVVQHDGRGFPPDIARRKLERMCLAAGHTARPQYRAGISISPHPMTQPTPLLPTGDQP